MQKSSSFDYYYREYLFYELTCGKCLLRFQMSPISCKPSIIRFRGMNKIAHDLSNHKTMVSIEQMIKKAWKDFSHKFSLSQNTIFTFTLKQLPREKNIFINRIGLLGFEQSNPNPLVFQVPYSKFVQCQKLLDKEPQY